MENASKALIIAGAILISILLISVGIIIMNAINDPVSRGAESATTQGVKIFNSHFSNYEGVRTGAQLRDLSSDVIASNANDVDHEIALTLPGGAASSAYLRANTEYNVTFVYDNDGYISEINVEAP